MTTYNEADHNRDAQQRYAAKPARMPSIDPLKPAYVRKPGELGGYELRGMKTLRNGGREGDSWTATIYFNGKREISVRNGGDGGGNWYDRIATTKTRAETTEEMVKQRKVFDEKKAAFLAMAAKAFPENQTENADEFVGMIDFLGMIERDLAKHPTWNRANLIEMYIQENIKDVAAHRAFPYDGRMVELLRNPDQLDEA